jgi:hypothetical protein
VVPPAPADCDDFTAVDEKGYEEYRKSEEGGCACLTERRCESTRCRKCWVQGLPCTARCKCKGLCGNPHKMPLPKCLSELSEVDQGRCTLAEIVASLTPKDVEFWSLKHGRFGHYWLQYKLCDRSEAKDCWYCSRFGVRQLPRLSFFPITPTPNGQGGWKELQERAKIVRQKLPKAARFTSSESLPSYILKAEFKRDRSLEDDRLRGLVASTNLKPETIVSIWERLTVSSFDQADE